MKGGLFNLRNSAGKGKDLPDRLVIVAQTLKHMILSLKMIPEIMHGFINQTAAKMTFTFQFKPLTN